ncbi:MAG: helix-turn-helix transcriptional regulator [Methylocystis sp.]|uniref:helix-turn-helix transcriptional regulator n=1 Tax=Methylocystis sp. TaxID=1911079 RepID=UPI003DA4C02F
MTPVQCREARELLGLTEEQLADMADLSGSTVADFEAGRGVADCLADALEVTLEAAGAEFIADGGGAGVRLRNRVEPKEPASSLGAADGQ